jgi:hypothetical protein
MYIGLIYAKRFGGKPTGGNVLVITIPISGLIANRFSLIVAYLNPLAMASLIRHKC